MPPNKFIAEANRHFFAFVYREAGSAMGLTMAGPISGCRHIFIVFDLDNRSEIFTFSGLKRKAWKREQKIILGY